MALLAVDSVHQAHFHHSQEEEVLDPGDLRLAGIQAGDLQWALGGHQVVCHLHGWVALAPTGCMDPAQGVPVDQEDGTRVVKERRNIMTRRLAMVEGEHQLVRPMISPKKMLALI